MRARYLGDHSETTLFGIRFPKGVFVEVADPTAQRKLSNNNHFEVERADAEEVTFTETPRRGRKPKAE